MPKQILTDKFVDNLVAGDKPKEYSDADCTGLLLRVQPSGKKFFYLMTWTPDTAEIRKRYRYKIGEYPDYRLFKTKPRSEEDRARDIRAKARRYKVLAETIDLRERKKEAAQKGKQEKISTLGAFLDGPYLEYAKDNHRGDSDAEIRYLKSSFKSLEKKRIDSITSWHINQWLIPAKKTLKPATIHRRLGALSAVFSHAIRKKLITVNPLSKDELDSEGITIPKPDGGRTRHLSQDEEKRLREALTARDRELKAKNARYVEHCNARPNMTAPALITGAYADHLTPLALLALNTGIRLRGLLTICWSNISDGQIYVPPHSDKIKKGYKVPLSKEATMVLRLWRQQSKPNPGDQVFLYKGKPIKSIKSAWNTVLEKAKLEDFRFHDLRHTFASKLVMGIKGKPETAVPLYTVSQLLGHRSLEMTRKYAHLSPDHMKEALKVLDGGAS